MKEYLMPSRNYEYILTDAREALEPHAKDWIEIPEGAEILSTDGDGVGLIFWKDDFNLVVGLDDHWDETFRSFKDFFPMYPRCKVLWQRPAQPEALPFIDDNPQSLNDQYAEIEQVRQAIKAKSGSDSDHTADAMAYGFMGFGTANGSAKMRENNHYFIDVSDVDEVDFYEIAKRYNVTDPAIQHILKKCLAIGNRGHKDLETDLKDILKTAKRALQINGFGE